MVTTNFPSGVTSFGMPVVGSGSLPVINGVTGAYWFVDSVNGSAGNPGTFDAPFASLATAVTAAAVNDVIVLAPGHAETISAAGGISLSKAGLQVVGMGSGSKRPTFTFATSTAATMTITAASVSLTNIIATTSVDQVVSPFVVSAADVTLGIEWRDGSSVLEAVRAVLTTAAANRLRLTLRYIGFTAGTHGVNAVRLVGGTGAVLNLDVFGKFSTAVVEFATTATIDTEISGYVYNSGTTNGTKNVVDTITGSTWYANFYDGASGLAASGGSGAALTGTSFAAGVATAATAVMVNGNTIFTIAGGPVRIESIVSVCVSANDATASTLQYQAVPTIGSSQTISAASASLANAAAGATVTLAGTALATPALYNANGPNLIANPGTIVAPIGTIKVVIGVGSTTGTWQHLIRYLPLVAGATVS